MHKDYKTKVRRGLMALALAVVSSVPGYAQEPVNDGCMGAINIIPNDLDSLCNSLSGSSLNATASGIYPQDCGSTARNDVWYSFTAGNAYYKIKLSDITATNNSVVYHSYVAALYGGSCGALEELTCNGGVEEIGNGPAEDVVLEAYGLTVGEVYYIQIHSFFAEDGNGDEIATDINFDLCVALPYSPPTNDDATGAIALTVGAPCTGNIYTNINATPAPGEPYINSSAESIGTNSVWFQFVAPASGSVKISTDIGPLGTLGDSKIGLFQAPDPSDYGTFEIIACDDDSGVQGEYMSILYTTGLVGGQTYYIQVDGYSEYESGSFCLTVEEINPTMLASAATCADIQLPSGDDATYTGWFSLVDETGKLVAMIQNVAGETISDYSGSYHVDGSGFMVPRLDGNGVAYLARNYMISTTTPSVVPKSVRFFFHPGEIATLAGFTNQQTTLANLNVTRQEGNVCNPDFLEGNGPTTVLNQTAHGSVNGVSWIEVNTPGFSNFYLMGGAVPLDVTWENITATNVDKANRIDWVTVPNTADQYFALERSIDGKHFDALARIPAMAQEGYTYWDRSPFAGMNYYRLKIVDRDGKYQYSQIVSAQLAIGIGSMQVNVYPNPVINTLQVRTPEAVQATIGIYDLAGKQLRNIMVSGANTDIDMSDIAPGIYFLKYMHDNYQETIRITKQ